MQNGLTKDKAEQSLKCLSYLADDLGVGDVADHVLGNYKFGLWSACSHPTAHHYGDYGLVIHTQEVVSTSLKMADLYPQYEIKRDVLFLAALFHDVGKCWDYWRSVDYDGVVTYKGTDHKRTIHHISRSALVWQEACFIHWNNSYGLRDYFADSVTHAILAHHGLRAWGSPVAPKSREAWLLHLCDGISARMYDADTLDRI